MQQIAEALDKIDAISGEILGRIGSRLSECQTKLRDIGERTERAQAKMQLIKGTTKAVTIFAPARYPEERKESLRTVFAPNFDRNPPVEDGEVKIRSRFAASVDARVVLKEKQQYFNVQTKPKEKGTAGPFSDRAKNLTSIADLLLFNTSINV